MITLDDGTEVRSLPEKVDYLTGKEEENEIAIDNLAARLEAAIAGVLHYKGSVATYADLPADAEIGDVYNCIDTGANYAWTGSEWDELGTTVDLSNLVTLNTAQTITADKKIDGASLIIADDDNQSEEVVLYNGSDALHIAIHGSDVYKVDANSLSPADDNVETLGDSSHFWKEFWANQINLGTSGILKYENGAFSFNDDLIPAVTESYDLGASSYKWNNLHLKGKINPNASGYGLTLPDTSALTADDEILDARSNQNIYGTKKTKRIQFVNNVANPSGTTLEISNDNGYNAKVMFGSKGLMFNNVGIIPHATGGATMDLGSSEGSFRDIRLSRNLTDGTNSVTVADLKALIDYAKAQGWIS